MEKGHLFFVLIVVLIGFVALFYNAQDVKGSVSDVYIGRGCTTAWQIDWDCDGYGVGAQNVECRGDCGATRQGVPGDKQDADDNDTLINTPATVHSDSRYGNPLTNFVGFKELLNRKFGFTVGNVYFVSNSTSGSGQVNDVNSPYPISSIDSVINLAQGGDVILFREGVYYDSFSVLSIDNKVSFGNPLVVAAYPGENVRLEAVYALGVKNSTNIIIDGFVLTCTGQCPVDANNFWGGLKGIDLDLNDKMVIQNMEITRFQWGVHGGFDWGNTTFRKIIAHDNSPEHGIYSPSNCFPSGVPHLQRDITIEDSLLYRNRRTGYQNNGPGENINLQRNIIHSNGGAGVTFTSGVQNSNLVNNLIFNNNHYGVVIWHDDANPEPCTRNNENNELINNVIFQGTEWNGVCNSGGDRDANGWITCAQQDNPATFSTFSFGDNRVEPNANFTGHKFRNNIFVTQGAPIFSTNNIADIYLSIIENNILYRADGNPLNGFFSWKWANNGETDGSHSSASGNPAKYYWNLTAMQNHSIWGTNIKNNILANNVSSLFRDIGTYVFTPGLYNFLYSSSSIAIDFGTGTPGTSGVPLIDLLGNFRSSLVDSGVYEFINSTSSSGNSSGNGTSGAGSTGGFSGSGTGVSGGFGGNEWFGNNPFSGNVVGYGLPIMQCSDGIDNDGDNLIDYSNDLGCIDSYDDDELDGSLLIIQTESSQENKGSDKIILSENKRVVNSLFWAVLGLIISGILIFAVLIIRTINFNRNFNRFAKPSLSNQIEISADK